MLLISIAITIDNISRACYFVVANIISAIKIVFDSLLSLFKNGGIIITAPNQPAERLIKRSETDDNIARLVNMNKL